MKVVNEVEMMEVDLYLFISLTLPPGLTDFIVPYLRRCQCFMLAAEEMLHIGYYFAMFILCLLTTY